MIGPIWESLWNSRIGKWFSLGKRWILLIPPVWILLVITVLVSAQFGLIAQAFALPDPQTIITNPYFLIFSAAIVLLCPIIYRIDTHRPPPKDRFVVAIASFHFPPGDEDAKKEASNVHHRVSHAIQTRMHELGMRCSTPVPRETAQEPIDPGDDEGKERARLLGRHYRAHMVVCGTVRLHGPSYYLQAYIENLATHRHRFSPSGYSEPLDDIPVPERHSYTKQKVDENADLATFMCALAKINRFEYEEAKMLLDTIGKPSAEVWFYRGLTRLELGEKLDDVEQAHYNFEQARSCFEEACRLRPNFAFALMYAGIASRKLSKKIPVGYASLTSDELSAGYYILASTIPPEESLADSTRRDKHLAQDISKKLLANQLADLEELKKLVEGFENMSEKQAKVLSLHERNGALFEVVDEARQHSSAGEEHINAGNLKEAVEELHRATELFEQAAQLELELDVELDELLDRPEGEELCNRITEPDHGSAWAYKALALAKLSRSGEAGQAAQRGTALNGDPYLLARAYAALEDKANALAHLSVATKDDPYKKLLVESTEEFDQFRGDEEFVKLVELRTGELEEARQSRYSEMEITLEESETLSEKTKEFLKKLEERQKHHAELEERRQRSLLLQPRARMTMAAKRRVRINPGSFRFRLGKYECLAINDGIFNYPLESFFANAPLEQVKEVLHRHNLPTEQIATFCTSLLVDTGQHRVLIDTGAGALGFWARQLSPKNVDDTTTVTGRLVENMKAVGVEPADIDVVIITHAQPEQVGGTLDEYGEIAFPNAWHVISENEARFLDSEAATTRVSNPKVDAALVVTTRQHLSPLRDRHLAKIEVVEIVPGFTVIPTPGHTPGHTALSITSDGEQLLHVSDTVLHPLHLEHPEWTSVFDLSPAEAVASKCRIFDLAAEEQALVFAHRFPPFPNLGRVVKGDEGWQWHPIEREG